MRTIAQTLEVRSVRNLKTGCLEWAGCKTAWGYGQLRVKQKTLYAHRASFELHFGASAKGKFVCHKCDNPSCIEPSHLFLGTNEDNMKDCASKNRTAKQRGEASGKAKLTDIQACEIWIKRRSGASNVALSIEYGIDATVISRIANGKAWPHINDQMQGTTQSREEIDADWNMGHFRSLKRLAEKGLI